MFKYLILFLLASTNAIAQDLSPKIQEVLRFTLAADGQLTQEMHNDFWGELQLLGSEREMNLAINSIKANILFAQEFQKELWKSAKISKDVSQVVKTARLIELDANAQIMFEKSIPYPKGSQSYNTALSTWAAQRKVASENASELLESAASGKPMTAAQGQVLVVDDQLIDSVLPNIDASFSRMERLLTRKWQSTQ